MSEAKRDKLKALLAKRNKVDTPTTPQLKDVPKKKVIIDYQDAVKVVEKPVITKNDYTVTNSGIDKDAGVDSEQITTWKNKQGALFVGSRGIGMREKHIMMDLMCLLPHSKKESKIEKENVVSKISRICESNSCNNQMYFEQRLKGHCYLWMGKYPEGPSCKFVVENTHTTQELKLVGNCLKTSRPILSFDNAFNKEPQLQVLKELFIDTFGAPKNHPKTKAIVDHTFNFTWNDNRVWFRNYQHSREEGVNNKASDDYELLEIGPRFSLCPIKIFEGFLDGTVLYANPNYIAPKMQTLQKNKLLEAKFRVKDKKKLRKEDQLQKVQKSDAIDKLYDEEKTDDTKEKKNDFGKEDGDSELYEENSDDYDED